jgi:hypothetical protein
MFESPSQFSFHIEEIANKTGDTYIETILSYCDDNFVDYDDVAKMITPVLKQKIFEQASSQYSMPKSTTSVLEDD